MPERPIIFSPRMVAAILDGRKTQTRRPGTMSKKIDAGDVLWVRERWRIHAWDLDTGSFKIEYAAPNGADRLVDDAWRTPPDEWHVDRRVERLLVQCSDDAMKAIGQPDADGMWSFERSPCRWRPSIHMPRWASRITLRVEQVRHQRLHDITEDDARAEGVDTIAEFAALWDEIHAGKAAAMWDDNPAVIAITFKTEGLRA